jgi:hypothetical protein
MALCGCCNAAPTHSVRGRRWDFAAFCWLLVAVAGALIATVGHDAFAT